MFNLGLCYLKGTSAVVQDFGQAAALFLRVAEAETGGPGGQGTGADTGSSRFSALLQLRATAGNG